MQSQGKQNLDKIEPEIAPLDLPILKTPP